MCHRVIEKILKGYYVKIFNEVPPYTHSLEFLSRKSGLQEQLSKEQLAFIDTLDPLNIKTRCPDYKEKLLKILTPENCKNFF